VYTETKILSFQLRANKSNNHI